MRRSHGDLSELFGSFITNALFPWKSGKSIVLFNCYILSLFENKIPNVNELLLTV